MLRINTKYKITFGPELFSKNVKVSSTSTSFSTMDYKLSMSDAEFYIDPDNTSVKRVTFSLTGNVPFSNDDFSKKISMTLV